MDEREREPPAPRETFVPVDGARLYVRDIGSGAPIIIVHGGPDFDHYYLRPELDRLAGSFRLVYYDQRGRGLSAAGVSPGDVSIRSEITDLDRIRAHVGSDSVGVLGHSWGAVVALEYAIRHADRVSRLILMNAAPASRDDWLLLRRHVRLHRSAEDADFMATMAASPEYARGDPDAEIDYYRAHFRATLPRPDLLQRLVGRLRRNFTADDVLTARAIEQRLYDETWLRPGYDLLPDLHRLAVPALVIHGEHDLIPLAAAAHISEAVPGARLSVLAGCGHFAYLERPDQVHQEISTLPPAT